MDILKDLKDKNIFNNITSEEKFKTLKKGDGIYIGFDPTAESLHLGNYIQILNLKRFEKLGFKPIAVLGGATGMIGDPSFKSEERQLLDFETIEKNKNKIKKQLESFGLRVVDNFDFYKDMNILTFLRDVGKLLSVNYMLSKDSVKSRLENGLSFTEFSYQLIQGWDFKELFEKEGVKIQMGASDQWGNITAGLEIIRKIFGETNAIGITSELLNSPSGKKFGKSEGNAIWLDSSMTSSFQMYQYFLSIEDGDLETYFNWLTMLNLQEIEQIIQKHFENPKLQYGQKKLAQTLVNDIHGKEETESALMISQLLFENKELDDLNNDQIETLKNKMGYIEIKDNGLLLEQLVEAKIASSKRESRELISQNAIFINNNLINDINYIIQKNKFKKIWILLKKGKKQFFLGKIV